MLMHRYSEHRKMCPIIVPTVCVHFYIKNWLSEQLIGFLTQRWGPELKSRISLPDTVAWGCAHRSSPRSDWFAMTICWQAAGTLLTRTVSPEAAWRWRRWLPMPMPPPPPPGAVPLTEPRWNIGIRVTWRRGGWHAPAYFIHWHMLLHLCRLRPYIMHGGCECRWI